MRDSSSEEDNNEHGDHLERKEENKVEDIIRGEHKEIRQLRIQLQIIDKNRLGKIKLKNNDKIEIVHFIGGG